MTTHESDSSMSDCFIGSRQVRSEVFVLPACGGLPKNRWNAAGKPYGGRAFGYNLGFIFESAGNPPQPAKVRPR